MNDISRKYKVAGIGEVLWDVFPCGEKFGGAPANFICHCHSLGAEAYIISCIGNDERGVKARRFLDKHGVDTSCLKNDSAHETGVVIVELDDAGKPEYEIKECVAWDNIPWMEEMGAVARQLDAVCFGSLSQRSNVSRSTIQKFLAATSSDCLRVFDINIRQNFYSDEIIRSSLESANVLKLNDEELPIVAELINANGSDEAVIKLLIKQFGLKLAALTRGDKGSLMATPDSVSDFPGIKADIVDTVGAGDSFTSAMIMGFLNNKSLERINEEANRLAAFVCSQAGGVPALPASLI